MKLIKSSYKIIPQEAGLEGIYRQIEYAGRICYKSSDKITEDSAKPFVDRMIKSGHGAMLEHGTVYLDFTDDITEARKRYIKNPYSKVYKNTLEEDWDYPHLYVVTNLRVLVENDWLKDLKYICEPTEYHEERLTIHFTTQIAISREFNRHRVNSMAEQSTRYCDYSGNNEKFEGVGINLPNWVNIEINKLEEITTDGLPSFEQLKEEYFSVSDQGITKDDWGDIEWWLWSSLIAEESYQNLRKLGRKPQEARVVLPLDTNTELVHTAFVSDWEHFFKLRCNKTAHPDARILAEPLMKEFIARKYINN